jgi:glucose/arabinose dehydrogenase
MSKFLRSCLAAIALSTSVSAQAGTDGAALATNAPLLRYAFPTIASGFTQPVFVTHAGDARLFVVEQAGVIKVIKNGQVLAAPFLDINARVRCCTEEGLLGLAFEPNFASTRRFYVYYTNNNGDQVIARYLSNGGDGADPNSERILMTIPHPNNGNHNGGWLGFGPDNLLYASIGDGGGGGDPDCTGEDPLDWRGKILRIDVIGKTSYSSPAGNIFMPAAQDQLPEVWAVGLRNAWRNSFDRESGELWLGDVGQDNREEVNVLAAGSNAGANFGWSRFEGTAPFSARCTNRTGQTERSPVFDYGHDSAGGSSVTGGYVYRGAQFPSLRGNYYVADFASRRMWSIYKPAPSAPRAAVLIADTIGFSPSSFGEDVNGELYVVDYGGSVRRLFVWGDPLATYDMVFLPILRR